MAYLNVCSNFVHNLTIHKRSGSRPDVMVDFIKYFEDSYKFYLSYNYRSPSNIVNISKRLIDYNVKRNQKEILAFRKNNSLVNTFYCENEKDEVEKVVNKLLELKDDKEFTFKENALLFRTNLESHKAIEMMYKNRIPFQLMNSSYTFFDHYICKDIISYMKLAMDISDKKSFLSIINRPKRYLAKLYLEKLKINPFKVDCIDYIYGLPKQGLYVLRELSQLRRKLLKLKKLSTSDAIGYILDDIGYTKYIKERAIKSSTNYMEELKIVEELKEISKDYEKIEQFLDYFEGLISSIHKSQYDSSRDSILLSTIHGVKGMEFNNVFIINCIEDYLPHKNSLEKNIEEERRLFYVAITRTKERLFLYVPKYIKDKDKMVSRFIGECGLELL